MEILDVYNDLGTVHDFRMFKESLAGILPEDILALLDSGYQGVHEYLPNALIPFKSSKNKPLTNEQRAFNTYLSKGRIAIEHINREIKIFRICKGSTPECVDDFLTGMCRRKFNIYSLNASCVNAPVNWLNATLLMNGSPTAHCC